MIVVSMEALWNAPVTLTIVQITQEITQTRNLLDPANQWTFVISVILIEAWLSFQSEQSQALTWV